MRSPPATKKKMTSENHPAAESKAILSEKTDTELVKGARNKDTHKELSKPQLQAQKMSRQSYITIHEDIKEELRKGNYKVNIAPSDLVDFGGQKDKTLIYTNLHSVVTSPCGYSGKGSQRSNFPLNIKINSPLCCINN
jgi:anti-sigma28 factor (negative regulator of flagellin synthesis)